MMTQSIAKVGRTTGWTRGRVTNTCMNVPLQANRTFVCQGLAYNVDGAGDGGSPVFEITNFPNAGDVQLLGIFWGGLGTELWFSPVGGIYRDLGMTDAWDSCDPDFDC